jgi:hypothetical protein
LALLTILLAGCGAASGPQIPPPGSPIFQAAYREGCRIGFIDAGGSDFGTLAPGRDEQLYASDADYRSGWDSGHQACFAEEQRFPRMLRPDRGFRRL